MCLTKINAITPTLHYTSESLRINIAAVLLQSSLHLANSHCPTYASCGLDGRCQALCDTAHCECQCKASRIRIYEAQPSNVGCTLTHPTSALLRSLILFATFPFSFAASFFTGAFFPPGAPFTGVFFEVGFFTGSFCTGAVFPRLLFSLPLLGQKLPLT